MLRKTGLSSLSALANASSHHGYQSTGLSLCCSRYGDFSRDNLFMFVFPFFSHLLNERKCMLPLFSAAKQREIHYLPELKEKIDAQKTYAYL